MFGADTNVCKPENQQTKSETETHDAGTRHLRKTEKNLGSGIVFALTGGGHIRVRQALWSLCSTFSFPLDSFFQKLNCLWAGNFSTSHLFKLGNVMALIEKVQVNPQNC